MGNVRLTDALLEYLGRKYEEKKAGEIIDRIYENDTFISFVNQHLRSLQH